MKKNTKLGCLQRKTNGNGDGGHHQYNGGYHCKATFRVSGASWVRFGEPPTLATEFWGGDYGAQVDFQVIQVMDVQRSPNLGGLQGTDVRAPHQTRQVPQGKSSWSVVDLASDGGEVCAGGDKGGVQGVLRDETTLWCTRGGD